jgi:hypothetical protein
MSQQVGAMAERETTGEASGCGFPDIDHHGPELPEGKGAEDFQDSISIWTTEI